MQLMDLVRFQVELFSLGSECRRDFSPDGWLLTNRQDPNFYLNAFYPAQLDFQYPQGLRNRLREHYSASARDGYAVHYGSMHGADLSCAAILVPADIHLPPAENPEAFACHRTDDLDAWCEAYVAGSPHIPLAPFRDRAARLCAAREVHRYLFTVRGRTIGGGSLVHMGGGAFLANGYSVMEAWRGDILSRARMVRMSTTDDVLAITSTRFARVLRRAMPQVRELGRLDYLRLDRGDTASAVQEAAPQEPAVSAAPATL